MRFLEKKSKKANNLYAKVCALKKKLSELEALLAASDSEDDEKLNIGSNPPLPLDKL